MWAKVDDGWWCHHKVMGLPLPARGLWISALSWSCHQRTSLVPSTFLAMVGGSNDEATALVDAGLWVVDGCGWRIHDWDDYQEKSLSEKRAEAGRKGGQKSRPPKQPGSNAEATAEAGTRPDPSRPTPRLRGSQEPTPHYDHAEAQRQERKAQAEADGVATPEQREAALSLVKAPRRSA